MKRPTPRLLWIALAAWGTACTTGTGTGPDPVASGPIVPARWTGSAIAAEDAQHGLGSWNNRFEVQVTWAKVENPSPAPPPGTTRYVPSGSVRAIMRSFSDVGRCEVNREGQFPVSPPAETLLPDEQQLDVGSDGRYQGKLYGAFQIDYLQICRDGTAFQSRTVLHMSLDIAGALDAGRMHGDMPPKVITVPPTLSVTRTGSWNFTAN
jgi:hypothetical protein